jgi:lipopolysaccharide/colanic/teichoic acid biosynthesis glycosyltransferase
LPEEKNEAARVPISLNGQASSLGPRGLTGIVQVQPEGGKLDPDEIEQLKLYYAKNQTLALDMEILLKATLARKRERI